MIPPPKFIDQWMHQLNHYLTEFIENPLGGAEKGLMEIMKQYKEAVKDKLVEPPKFWRGRR